VRAGEWRRGTSLPLFPLPFVGREQEIADVWRLVEQRQILTLTGAGGVGKTRLAVEAARRQVPLMRDGAWFAELATLADPALVPQAVAAALGVDIEGAFGHTSALVDALRPRRLLLVLDNCEHLAEACAELVDAITRDCPHVRVLATSREPLGCRGEAVWPVPRSALRRPPRRPCSRPSNSSATTRRGCSSIGPPLACPPSS
jgi:predicted ATPase